MIKIKIVIENKKKYLPLLLLADPYEVMIDRYLQMGKMFVLYDDDRPICQAVVTKISKNECELKNIATDEDFQHRGHASSMINYIVEIYSNEYSKMFVGTTESAMPFYEGKGFKYSHRVKNFFTDNYPEPIFENQVQCIDMLYLKKEL